MAAPPPAVKPEAADQALGALFQEADRAIQLQIRQLLNTVNDGIILPAVFPPAEEIVQGEWLPRVKETVDANLSRFVDEVIKDLPKMVSEAIDIALGDAGRSVLQQLARNEYTCALPCNCEPGCPGIAEEMDQDDQGPPGGGSTRFRDRDSDGDQDPRRCGGNLPHECALPH